MANDQEGGVRPELVAKVLDDLFDLPNGFILEGFPRVRAEAEVFTKQGYLPDAVLMLRIDAETLWRRKVTSLGAKYFEKLAQDEKNRKLGENEEHVDPKEALHDQTIELVAAESDRVTDVVDFITSIIALIPIIEVEASRSFRATSNNVGLQMAPFLENRQSLFEKPQSVPELKANRLLSNGYKHLSLFGRFCPVELARTSCCLESSIGTRPVVHGDFIYYLKNKKNQELFISNIVKFISQPRPLPVVRPAIAVLGPSKSGKTTLAKRLCKTLDLEYLEMSQVLTVVVAEEEESALKDEMMFHLRKGHVVPTELCIKALQIVLGRAACKQKGWVLDNFPITIDQAKLMEKVGIIPHVVFNTEVPLAEATRRAMRDFSLNHQSGFNTSSTLELESVDIVSQRYNIYEQNKPALIQLYHTSRGIWHSIETSQSSKWANIFYATNVAFESVLRQEQYLDAKSRRLAVALKGTGIHKELIEKQLGKFKHYGPVNLVDYGRLQFCGAHDPSLIIEYRDQYFKVGGPTERELFIQTPEKYIHGPDLPANLPRILTVADVKAAFPQQIEMRGFCPVTFADVKGPRFESLVLGIQLYAEFEGKIYAFADGEKLQRFMSTPWKYVNLTLPHKLPPPKMEIPIQSLPIMGYLEQTVATAVNHAVLAVGNVRPKYPFKSLRDSAIEYVSLYLRANNPNVTPFVREKINAQLENLSKDSDAVKYLVAHINDAAEYADPTKRPALIVEALQRYDNHVEARQAAAKKAQEVASSSDSMKSNSTSIPAAVLPPVRKAPGLARMNTNVANRTPLPPVNLQ